MFFEFKKNSRRMQTIIRYIIPVVCGMLISTALSLLRQASSVLISEGAAPVLSITIVTAVFLIMLFLQKKYGVKDVLLLLIGGVGTLTVLGIIKTFSL